jgi:hypothetical protein
MHPVGTEDGPAKPQAAARRQRTIWLQLIQILCESSSEHAFAPRLV